MIEVKFIRRDAAKNITPCPPVGPKPRYVIDYLDTPAGLVPRVEGILSRADRMGAIRSRISAYRMKYVVTPGLYAIGQPTAESPVVVTANYKLSFDEVRSALSRMDAWILVLDTKGINVWCAAGKGTFGTDELAGRISLTGLHKVVTHRRIILPQLGAVGVAAHEVSKRTGFHVSYGPVRAIDLPSYILSGGKATAEMRKARFTLLDRLVLTPMELNPAMKRYPLFALIVLLIFGLRADGVMFRPAIEGGAPFLVLGLMAVFSGALLSPALLPWIPFRSFALKGLLTGFVAVYGVLELTGMLEGKGMLLHIAAYLFFPAASSYLALQFTGSTTYTGMSGVKKELRYALPLYLTATICSTGLLIAYRIAGIQ